MSNPEEHPESSSPPPTSTPPAASPAQTVPDADANQNEADVQRQLHRTAWEKVRRREEPCPVCGRGPWVVGDLTDLALRVPGSETGTILTAKQVYPLVPIFCANCGFTQFFMAKTLLRSQPPLPDKPEEQK